LVREFGVHLKEILVYERVAEALQVFCANHSIDDVYNENFLDIVPFVEESVTNHLLRFVKIDHKKFKVLR